MISSYMLVFIANSLLVFILPLLIGWLISTPILEKLLKYKVFKTSSDRKTLYGEIPTQFLASESSKGEQSTPRMGGLVVVFVVLLALFPYLLYENVIFNLIYFIFLVGAMLGVLDDISDIGVILKAPVKIRSKLLMAFLVGATFGYVLYNLSLTELSVFTYTIELGGWVVLVSGVWFLLWLTPTVIDGIDALAGSVFSIVFLFFVLLFTLEGEFLLVLFSIAIVAGLIVFLGKNTQPAKWYLTETGCTPLLFSIAALSLYSGLSGWVRIFLYTSCWVCSRNDNDVRRGAVNIS